MKLTEGALYNVLDTTCYYCGLADTNGQICDCCGRITEQAHNFKVPCRGATYKEVVDGAFEEQVNIGNTCIKKLQIEQA